MKRIAAAVLLLAVIAAIAWYMRRRRAPGSRVAAGSAAQVDPTPAVAPANSVAPPAAVAPEPPRLTHLTPEERQRKAAQIDAAHRAHAASTPPRLPDGSATDDSMETAQAVLVQLQQATDQIRDDVAACGKLAPEVKSLRQHITLTGDPDIGTLIDAPDAGSADDGTPLPRAFDDCVRGHLQLLELPPMKTDMQFTADFQITL